MDEVLSPAEQAGLDWINSRADACFSGLPEPRRTRAVDATVSACLASLSDAGALRHQLSLLRDVAARNGADFVLLAGRETILSQLEGGECDTCGAPLPSPIQHSELSFGQAYCESACLSRGRRMRKKYGLTARQFRVMLSAQNDACAICGDPIDLMTCHVDHHHEEGTVRALLCLRCNVMIGYARESARILWAAAVYLGGADTIIAKSCTGHVESQPDGRWRLVVNLVRAPDGRYRRRTRLTGGTRENAEAALQRWIRELSALCAARGTGS